MPNDFNKKSPDLITKPMPKEADTAQETTLSEHEAPTPGPSISSLILSDLSEAEKLEVESIRKSLVENNLIFKMMFDDQVLVELNIMKQVTCAVRPLTTAEKENLDSYLYGKDPYKLYEKEDNAEMDSLAKTYPDKDPSELRELFLRSFPRDLALSRNSLVALSLALIKINNKSLGDSVASRFAAIRRLPLMLVQQIRRKIMLLEKAINLEISEEASIKN